MRGIDNGQYICYNVDYWHYLRGRKEKMLPSEMVILMAIEASNDSGKKLLASTVGPTQEYICSLYHSLARRGFLKKKGLRGHELTTEGREILFEFLLENKTRVITDTIKTLQQLGIEASKEIDALAKEVLEVK